MKFRNLLVGALATVALSGAALAYQDTPAARAEIQGLEQGYAQTKSPQLRYLLAERYAAVGDRAGLAASLKDVVASGRSYYPPSYSRIWEFSSDPEVSKLLATLKARMKPTSNGALFHEVRDRPVITEGIAYDGTSRRFFLGDFLSNSIVAFQKGGKSSVLVGDLALSPFGMVVDEPRRLLWVATSNSLTNPTASKSALVRVDLRTGKAEAIPVEGTSQLNDVTVAKNGDVFTSDIQAGTIWRVKAGSRKLEPVVPPGSLAFPNGLALNADESTLYVVQGLRPVAIDVAAGKFAPLTLPDGLDMIGTDGLYFRNGSLYGIQNLTMPGRVLRFDLDEAGKAIRSFEVLDFANPRFDLPTTGAIVGDQLVVIANAQLGTMIATQKQAINPKPIMLLSYPLKR